MMSLGRKNCLCEDNNLGNNQDRQRVTRVYRYDIPGYIRETQGGTCGGSDLQCAHPGCRNYFVFYSFSIFFVALISRLAFICCALVPGTLALDLPTLILQRRSVFLCLSLSPHNLYQVPGISVG